MQVHIETLKIVGQGSYKIGGEIHTFDRYTVEVTIAQDRREVRCSEPFNGHITIQGLAVRFQTGAKVWPGSAIYWLETGTINQIRPNIDKHGSFSLVGFADDYEGKKVRSQHNAVA